LTARGVLVHPQTAALHITPYEGPADRWDTFVRAQSHWTHCHLYGWRAVMERALGHTCPYLVATAPDGTLRGILPLVRVKSFLFGHYLVSIPFLNYGGPLGDDEAVAELTQHAVRMAQDGHVKMLELRSRVPMNIDLPVSHRKITVVLDMPDGSEALWKRLDAKVRSQVRRPQKDGVTVRFGAEQAAPFFAIFAEHMRDLGTPTHARSLFETIAHVFPEDVLFGCAYYNDIPIAGGCGFRWGNEFEITWASALRAYNKLSPNMLLYWEFMKTTADAGVTLFNFGRCTPGAGTHKFKRQWGSRDEPLWWYERRADGAAMPAEGKGALGLGPRIWKKLPLPIATAIGPRVIRFIP
jgi:FemAB-related protein (PEP-CTERM system-associated)